MNVKVKPSGFVLHDLILKQGSLISDKLHLLRLEQHPPNAQRTLREFSLAEAAYFLRTSPENVKRLDLSGAFPSPMGHKGRRTYTADQIQDMRLYLDERGRQAYNPRRKDGEPLQVISVINFKGGSSKTTSASHLAQHLSLTGHRVLVIDLDAQASLSALHGIQPELDRNGSMYDVIRYEKPRPITDVIQKTAFPLLDIVPANLDLQEYEYDTPVAVAQKNEAGRLFFNRIRNALKVVDDRYDVVVIDCPPQLGYVTLTALSASTSVLVAVHPAMLDVMSMSQFLLMLGSVLESIASVGAEVKLSWLRYLVTRYEPSDGPQTQMVGFLNALFPEQMLRHPMLKSTAISDAGITNTTLYEVERTNMTRSTYERALDSVNSVNDEITDLIHAAWGRKLPSGKNRANDL